MRVSVDPGFDQLKPLRTVLVPEYIVHEADQYSTVPAELPTTPIITHRSFTLNSNVQRLYTSQ